MPRQRDGGFAHAGEGRYYPRAPCLPSPALRGRCGGGEMFEFFQIIDICLVLSVPWDADKLASKREKQERLGITMNILPPIQEGFHRWIDSVAGTVNGLLNRLQSNHEVRIIENTPDTFTLRAAGAGRKSNVADHRIRIINGTIRGQLPADWAKMLRGSRAEMVLNANRFLFRPLELPKRAVEFLDGIVRAQIDRLTPWTPGEAVFSWTPPTDGPNDRIELTIAATARARVAPLVQAIADLGVASVAVLTVPADAGPHAAPIKVFEQRARGVFEIDRIRRTLVASFLISGLAAAITMGYSAFALDSLDAEQQALSQKISARRAALRASPEFTVSAQR